MPRQRVMERGRHFLLTCNNPTHTAEELIGFFVGKDWRYVFQLEAGENGTRHFQIYIRPPSRMLKRELIRLMVEFGCHPHVELARRWKQAMMYCCKQESRISETYYTDICEEITPVATPKLVEIKRKIDAGETLSSISNDEKYFAC